MQIAINSRDVAEAVADCLRNIPLPNKTVARQVGVTPRAVEDWKSAANAPGAAALIRLMAEHDEVYERVMRMTGRTPVSTISAEKRAAVAEILKILGEA